MKAFTASTLLACLLTGCAGRNMLGPLEQETLTKTDVVALCYHGDQGEQHGLIIREVWKSSDHPDWKYELGDILPPGTYQRPPANPQWCCGRSTNDYRVVFLTIVRRALVTDCGYSEEEARRIVPKEVPTFGIMTYGSFDAANDDDMQALKNFREYLRRKLPGNRIEQLQQ